MHFAAKGGYLDIVDFLRTHKADMNPLNDLDGEAPLHKAVREQTMDVIEALVDFGMDPNITNKKTGNTPLHVALESGAQEAMEGLLIKGAKSGIKNNDGQLPVDLAKTNIIRSTLQMYESLLISMNAGNIRAIGTKLTRVEMEKPNLLVRVGVIVAHLDIPEGFHTGIYCRREKVEHATVEIPHLEEEFTFEDVYHIRVFDVNQDCKALLYLPVYQAPSEKEEMVVRFLGGKYDDFVADEYATTGKNVYLPLEVTLVPDTTCICMINIRQRVEEKIVGEQEATITSDMDPGFAMDIQSGSFETGTVLSLQIIETNPIDDVAEAFDASESEEDVERKYLETATRSKATESQTTKYSSDLLTNLYQINLSGNQPKKNVTLTLPLGKGVTVNDNIVIIHANEMELNEENALEILPVHPQVANGKIVFEVSQFCVFTSTWLEKVDSVIKLREVQQSMVDAIKKRRPVSFYALVQQDAEDVTGLRHKVVIECHLTHKSQRQREKWVKRGYAEQYPPETWAIMAAPGDSFVADIQGNVRLEDNASSLTRKIQFLKSRPCQQSFYVRLQNNIYDQDDAFGYVIIYKSQKDNTLTNEIARLRIQVRPPIKAKDLPSSSKPFEASEINKMKNESKEHAQPKDLKMKSPRWSGHTLNERSSSSAPSVTSVIKRNQVESKRHAPSQDMKILSNKGSMHTLNERRRSTTDFFPSSPVPSATSEIKKNKMESKRPSQSQDLKMLPYRGSMHTRNERSRSTTDFFPCSPVPSVTSEITKNKMESKRPAPSQDLKMLSYSGSMLTLNERSASVTDCVASSPVPFITSDMTKMKTESIKNAQSQDLKMKSPRGSVHSLDGRSQSMTDFFARRDSLHRPPSQVSTNHWRTKRKIGIKNKN
ncbi:uncharacterized protein LOC127880061 [Dreissena polymorpha]|nr:uncharacterized protein LOC127880061 [Dreissena polymorpha]XP_052283248.1 uncharacterized protein LOC127880061 [Dreissena polymorpha]